MNPSIKDVARLSGTSISTVSNALSGSRNVSPELRERVLRAAAELGYTVNPIARNLKSGRSDTVLVVIADINCIFFAPLLKGVERVLSEAGYAITICDANFSQRRVIEAIRRMRGQRAKGVIVSGMSGDECTQFYHQYVSEGDMRETPVVNVEDDLSAVGIDSVFIDNYEAAYQATSHLIELGCRRILHIAGQSGVSRLRLRGYADALAAHGIDADEGLIRTGTMMPVSGCEATRETLRRSVKIDGVFAANDQMAVGALRALSGASIEVPDAVKVVGFDNTFISSIVDPALTTVSVPTYEMGKQAARLLLERISEPEPAARAVRMDYELIIRRSTVRTARTNWEMEYW